MCPTIQKRNVAGRQLDRKAPEVMAEAEYSPNKR